MSGKLNPILARYGNCFPFRVQERDIDLFLLEQLHVSPKFADWLTCKLGILGGEILTAHHSVYRMHGETDVLIHVKQGDKQVAVMIEDKIGAPMQPDQCERYHLRGKILCEGDEFDNYLTVLCAPANYLAGIPKDQAWDRYLVFEDLAQCVEEIGLPGWEWRQAMLLSAFSRAMRAREADNKTSSPYNSTLVPLKQAYRAFVEANYPQLIASRQEGRDREYYLKAKGLPAGIRFKHAFFRGEISMIFEKHWANEANQWFARQPAGDIWMVPHGSEQHVRMSVEVMDPILPFEQQEDIVMAALDRICNMISWAKSVAASGKA